MVHVVTYVTFISQLKNIKDEPRERERERETKEKLRKAIFKFEVKGSNEDCVIGLSLRIELSSD